ncbi:cupin domain-containing protein [Sphingomonas sp.]|uniref:cupin domain-containing protein n=1 Tax=Sphingomonas sp. TaxID=28214 RepID=UPI003BAA12D1
MQEARSLIDRLGLTPHPEGGWYKETWRSQALDPSARSPGTAILFLLEQGQKSHWHRVDADELWLWHAGSPLDLMIADAADANPVTIALGGDVLGGYQPQARVPTSRWQAADAHRGWALVSCIVVPGFDFAGFELAPPAWSPTC